MNTHLLKDTLIDPTFAFAFNTLVSIFVLSPDAASLTLNPHLPNSKDVIHALFKDPTVALGIALYAGILHVIRECQPLDFATRLRANWYLWNAVIFHTVMDGMVGLGFFPLLESFYNQLDRRFNENMVPGGALGAAHKGEIAVVDLVTDIELFVMAPVCLLAFVGIYKRAPWATAVEIVINVLHIFGTVIFMGPEFMTGCLNQVPFNKPGCKAGFTPFEIFFFYFAFGMGLIWIVVPAYNLYLALELSASGKVPASAGASSPKRKPRAVSKSPKSR